MVLLLANCSHQQRKSAPLDEQFTAIGLVIAALLFHSNPPLD